MIYNFCKAFKQPTFQVIATTFYTHLWKIVPIKFPCNKNLIPLLSSQSRLIIRRRLLTYNSDITWMDLEFDWDISLFTEENICINETIFWSLSFLRNVTQLDNIILMFSRIKKYINFLHKSSHLLSTYKYVTKTLWERYNIPTFSGEKIKAQRGKRIFPRSDK